MYDYVTKKGGLMQKIRPRPLSKYSKLVLQIELPLWLVSAVVFFISYLQARTNAPVKAAIEYSAMVGYLLFPLVITSFSVLLIERLLIDDT
jgi:predicted membrane-bound mannosyltransferase